MVPAARNELDALPPLSRYGLNLRLDPEARTLIGREYLTFVNNTGTPLSDLVLRLYPALPSYDGRVDLATVRVDDEPVLYSFLADGTGLRVLLPLPLAPGATAQVELEFQVRYPRQISGYLLFGESQGIISLPSAYPLLAVYEPSGWRMDIAPAHSDAVFSAAALYTVTLTAPTDLVVAATGHLVARREAGGQVTWHFVTGPVRDFALILSPAFQVLEDSVGDVTVRSYFLPEDRLAGQAALWHASAALEVYQRQFGLYPYADLAVVEAPLTYRGMEYPNLNLIGVDCYRQRQADMEFLVAHEISHQWWYNLVGSDPIRRPWLDEGLAEYSAYEYYRLVHGQTAADALLENRWQIPFNYALDHGLDAIVDQPAEAFTAANYETIVYAKAALFFHALRQNLGEEASLAVFKEYARTYRYRMATPEDLLTLASAISGQNLEGLYRRLILSAGERP